MNLKQFEYRNKDIPFLYRHIAMRFLFFILFLVLFVWQIISMWIHASNGGLKFSYILSAMIVLITSLAIIILSLMYCFKNFRIITAIKEKGSCVSSVAVFFSTKKASFIRLYKFINQIFALASLLVLVCSLTYTVLQISVLSHVSFYMPVLFLICITGFYSVFQISEEIKICEQVSEYNHI